MNTYDQREEKIILKDDIQDEVGSPFYDLSLVEFNNTWRKVTKRGDRYAEEHGTGEEWFEDNFPDSDHDRLGLSLRIINMDVDIGLTCVICIATRSGTFILQLRQYAANKHRSVARLLQKPNLDMIHAVITKTLSTLFDTDEPDVLSHDSIDAHLERPDLDNLANSMSHACFTCVPNIVRNPNICWIRRSEYDTHMCHYFRTILFHFLAVLKLITRVQQYFVWANLVMITETSADVQYRIVEIDFIINPRVSDHIESSDDDMKGEEEEVDEEEEEEEEEEEYDHHGDDNTYTITHNADGTTTTYRPLQYTRITSIVDEGRVLAERDQIEVVVEILIQQLDQVQLGRIAQRVSHQIRELTGQQQTVQPAVTESNFFNTRSFSSGSEGEEEN